MIDQARKSDSGVKQIYLQPGEFYFGNHNTRIRTLLGSCIAITLWHPRLRCGGMCHYMLPTDYSKTPEHLPDGRYAEEDAVSLFMHELKKTKSRPSDYEAKMFGGGNQFPERKCLHPHGVSDKNIHIGHNLLQQHGFSIKAEHVGGHGHRHVLFDISSGQVWLRHGEKTSIF